jgi:hypothetical protein
VHEEALNSQALENIADEGNLAAAEAAVERAIASEDPFEAEGAEAVQYEAAGEVRKVVELAEDDLDLSDAIELEDQLEATEHGDDVVASE